MSRPMMVERENSSGYREKNILKGRRAKQRG
jgi:hypothetical protein